MSTLLAPLFAALVVVAAMASGRLLSAYVHGDDLGFRRWHDAAHRAAFGPQEHTP